MVRLHQYVGAFGQRPQFPLADKSQDLKVAHDIYVVKVNRQRIKEQREKEHQQAIEDKAKFEELKSRYFGMVMADREIEIHSIDTIDDYYQIGEKQSICCGTAKYFLKEGTLILTTYISDKQIEDIIKANITLIA